MNRWGHVDILSLSLYIYIYTCAGGFSCKVFFLTKVSRQDPAKAPPPLNSALKTFWECSGFIVLFVCFGGMKFRRICLRRNQALL